MTEEEAHANAVEATRQFPKDSLEEHRRKWALQYALQCASRAQGITNLLINAKRIENYLTKGDTSDA